MDNAQTTGFCSSRAAMMSFGVLMLYSASSIMAQLDPRTAGAGTSFCGRWSGGRGGGRHDDPEEHKLRKFRNPGGLRGDERGSDAAACLLWIRRITGGCEWDGWRAALELAKPALVIFLAFL